MLLPHIKDKKAFSTLPASKLFSDVEQHKYERDIPAGEGGDQQAVQLLPSKAGDQADIFIYPVQVIFYLHPQITVSFLV